MDWCLADYDAVLTEAGDYTAKYGKLRDFFGSLSGTSRQLTHAPLRLLFCSEQWSSPHLPHHQPWTGETALLQCVQAPSFPRPCLPEGLRLH